VRPELQPHQILGRPCKVVATVGGIALAAAGAQKKESALFLIDEVGPAVTKYRVGDYVCPKSIMNIVLRDKTFYVVDEESIFCRMLDMDLSQIEIDGKPALPRTNSSESATIEP
jgi:hypothetical protein